jgi:hypothetical protein
MYVLVYWHIRLVSAFTYIITSEILLWHLITVLSIKFFAQSLIRNELTLR